MKKVGLVFLLLLSSAIAVLYYYWHQATQLPDWYSSQKAKENVTNISTLPASVEHKLVVNPVSESKSSNFEDIKVILNEADINNLVISKISEKTGESKLHEAIKAVNTTIKDGKMETGAVVNISNFPVEQLDEKEKAALRKLTKTFPGLTNREIYIAVVGKPSLENGHLKFDDNTEIKFGNLRFTISELSDKLGIPKEKLEQRINLELKPGKGQGKKLDIMDDRSAPKTSYN